MPAVCQEPEGNWTGLLPLLDTCVWCDWAGWSIVGCRVVMSRSGDCAD